MKEKKVSNVLGIVFTIIKIICVFILLLLIIVLGMQRFSNNAKTIGGYRAFNVLTGSMVPKYNVGDVLIVKEIAENDLKVGDDVAYLGKKGDFSGRVVTHQIKQIEESENGKVIHTQGIANDVEDPTITYDQIYGKVVYKTVLISAFAKLMNNLTAFYVTVFIPLGLLIFLQIKDIMDAKREEAEDEESEEESDESEE